MYNIPMRYDPFQEKAIAAIDADIASLQAAKLRLQQQAKTTARKPRVVKDRAPEQKVG